MLPLPEVVRAEDVTLDDLVDVAAEPLGAGAREGAVAAAEDRVEAVDDDLRVEKVRVEGEGAEVERRQGAKTADIEMTCRFPAENLFLVPPFLSMLAASNSFIAWPSWRAG